MGEGGRFEDVNQPSSLSEVVVAKVNFLGGGGKSQFSRRWWFGCASFLENENGN